MAEQTAIEWTDHTFNPWWGCEKVSPGCAHCYAEGVSNHRAGKGLWGAGHAFRFFGDKHWQEPLAWNRKAEREGVRRRVFCASMADVFEERDELDEHRWRLFELIAATPHLDWQILTKRPEHARDFLFQVDTASAIAGKFYTRDDPERFGWGCPFNVWLGVSIENARHTWRADVLREIPATVRFLSCEPLLGSLFESKWNASRGDEWKQIRKPLDLTGIDWVIIGGESGHHARPMRLDWAREIIAACHGQQHTLDDGLGDDIRYGPRPAIFVKQLGAKPLSRAFTLLDSPDYELKLRDRKGGRWEEWPRDLRIREFPAPTSVAPDSRPVPA